MGLNVRITIKGLSICYLKDNFWNVVLIGDPHHECTFLVNDVEHGESPLRRLNKIRTITFSIGTTPIVAPTKGAGFEHIFNLAASHAHGPNVLRVNPQGVTGKVHLKIPNADLKSGVINARHCYIQDASRPGSPVMVIPPVAKELIAELRLADGQPFGMRIDQSDEAPITIPLDSGTGSQITLEFDNDCKGRCRGNDATHLYQWVQAPDLREYYWGQVLPSGRFPTEEELQQNNIGVVIPDQGNCDPATSDPPPGP